MKSTTTLNKNVLTAIVIVFDGFHVRLCIFNSIKRRCQLIYKVFKLLHLLYTVSVSAYGYVYFIE